MNTNSNREDLDKIIEKFRLEGEPKASAPFGSGLINDTYRVVNLTQKGPDYVLQRINHYIFKNVPGLIDNILHVTGHLRDKLKYISADQIDKYVLTLIPAKDGQFYYQDTFGNFWRMYQLIPGTKSFDFAENEKQVFEGGAAFGRFQAMLADLDISLISDSIPDFHNIEKRLKDFWLAVEKDVVNRVEKVRDEISFIEERTAKMSEILEMGRAGKLPKRVIHSDTKFNNILFDENDKAQCVIDLDTVMVGYIAYDFGDAIRTIINTAPEDEADLEKIQLNVAKFKAYTEGYLSQTSSFITDEEVSSLIKAVLLLPYMQAVRFLTDYLDGDNYYKASFPEHNLQRTKAQIQLLRMLENNEEKLNNIIMDAFKMIKRD